MLLQIGDEGGCAEWPAGRHVLAQHVELPGRRVIVEKTAPVGDQSVEGARLDKGILGDAEMCPDTAAGPVLRPAHQPRPVRVALDVVPWPRARAARRSHKSRSGLARDCRANAGAG